MCAFAPDGCILAHKFEFVQYQERSKTFSYEHNFERFKDIFRAILKETAKEAKEASTTTNETLIQIEVPSKTKRTRMRRWS